MKRHYFIILFFWVNYSISQAQEAWGPMEHSDKWIEGHELFIKTLDSVKVKINFLETLNNQWWVFEAEFLNLSAVNDVLVDPTAIRYGATKLEGNERSCNLALSSSEVVEAAYIYNNKMIKKNTLEPKKSLFGYLIFKRCKYAKELTVSIPVSGRNFIVVFEKEK